MRSPVLLAVLMLCACDPAPSEDAGPGLDAALCTTAAQCNDGLFCNGEEQCVDGGCRGGDAPCSEGCNEESDACDADCVDEDNDGHAAVFCGGDDCDDTDANRYPGNTEVCDASHDEDCDPTTLGADGDGDGFISPTCCNGAVCGDDCEDAAIDVNPGAAERCNSEDDDCDGRVDEGSEVTCYADGDGDGYALEGAVSNQVCGECPIGTTERDPAESADCNDAEAAMHPGATELCNGVDDDCADGGIAVEAEDRDGDEHSSPGAACEGGPFPKDDCHEANVDVHGGQTAYFAAPYCPPGSCLCQGECYLPPSALLCGSTSLGTCVGTRVDFTFDYDCSGAGEPPPSVAGCICAIPGSCRGNGPTPLAGGAARACGSALETDEWSACGVGSCSSCSDALPNPGSVPCR